MFNRTSRTDRVIKSSKTSGNTCGEGKKHAFQSGGIFITIVNVVQIIPFRQSNDKSFICRNKE